MNVSSRKKNISTVIILVIILLVPGFLYVSFNRMCTFAYVVLLLYGEKVLTCKITKLMGREIPDNIFHKISAMPFIDNRGDSVLFMGTESIISVVHLYYAQAVGLSVAHVQNLQKVVEQFKNNHTVKF